MGTFTNHLYKSLELCCFFHTTHNCLRKNCFIDGCGPEISQVMRSLGTGNLNRRMTDLLQNTKNHGTRKPKVLKQVRIDLVYKIQKSGITVNV